MDERMSVSSDAVMAIGLTNILNPILTNCFPSKPVDFTNKKSSFAVILRNNIGSMKVDAIVISIKYRVTKYTYWILRAKSLSLADLKTSKGMKRGPSRMLIGKKLRVMPLYTGS